MSHGALEPRQDGRIYGVAKLRRIAASLIHGVRVGGRGEPIAGGERDGGRGGPMAGGRIDASTTASVADADFSAW